MAADHLTSQLKELREFLSVGNEESAKRLIETLNPLSVVDVEKVDFTKLPKDILGNSILIPDIDDRVIYKSRQPAKFAGFSTRFRRLLSLLYESKYVEEMDPQPSTFHRTPAT